MKYQIGPKASAFMSAIMLGIVLRFVPKEVSEMYDLILKAQNMFWPEIIACIAFLVIWFVVWNIQFFRTLRCDEEKKFRSSLNDKDKQFNALLIEREKKINSIDKQFDDILNAHLARADRHIKVYRESYEKRLNKLEKIQKI